MAILYIIEDEEKTKNYNDTEDENSTSNVGIRTHTLCA